MDVFLLKKILVHASVHKFFKEISKMKTQRAKKAQKLCFQWPKTPFVCWRKAKTHRQSYGYKNTCVRRSNTVLQQKLHACLQTPSIAVKYRLTSQASPVLVHYAIRHITPVVLGLNAGVFYKCCSKQTAIHAGESSDNCSLSWDWSLTRSQDTHKYFTNGPNE